MISPSTTSGIPSRASLSWERRVLTGMYTIGCPCLRLIDVVFIQVEEGLPARLLPARLLPAGTFPPTGVKCIVYFLHVCIVLPVNTSAL